MTKTVVITGTAIASPVGYGLRENLTAIREGVAQFQEISDFDTSYCPVRFAGICPKPDPKRLPDQKVQKILRRKDVIGLLTSIEAFENAGLKVGSVNPVRIGMYVGASSTRLSDLTAFHDIVSDCCDVAKQTYDPKQFGQDLMNNVNPLVVLQTLMNNGLCFSTMTLDIRGVNANFMDYQAAGSRAVLEAVRSIQAGRADVVLAGGVAGPVEPFQLADGVEAGYLADTSRAGLDISSVIRPYDRDRCGTIVSEGAAYLVLEEAEHAKRRGANILATVKGCGQANDPGFDFLRETTTKGLGRSMDLALKEAGLPAAAVGFVVGGGSGAIAGDLAEAKILEDAFGDFSTPITSPKSILGDMNEASGVASIIAAIDTLAFGEVAPVFNCKNPVSEQLKICREPAPIKGCNGLVINRNFMGTSIAVLVEKP